MLAFLLHECLFPAVRAGHVKWSAAAGTPCLAFNDLQQAGGALISEWTLAAAGRAEPHVPVNQGAAVNAGLFVACHLGILLGLTHMFFSAVAVRDERS